MPEQLRVAYFLPRFPQLTETFILREMLQLRNLGFDIHVFSLLPPFKTKTMHQQVQEMLPYAHYSPYILSWNIIFSQFYFLLRSPLKYIRALSRAIWQSIPEPMILLRVLVIFMKSVYFAKQVQQMKIQHIHAHFVWVNAIAAQIASDLTGITNSLHAHAWDIFQQNKVCVSRQLRLTHRIITVSKYHQNYLAELCPAWRAQDIDIVHYGLDPTQFAPDHVTSQDGKIKIISIGRLEEKKGHEYLIDAGKRLFDLGYLFHCSIVGSGILMEQLQARINEYGLQENITLHGAMNQSEIMNLFKQSDIFVLPCVIAKSGDRDGMPNVLLEAMAMQVPVITTPVTGNPELVNDGENGLLVPERDVLALTSAIERLINNPSFRHDLGYQGRKTVLEGFDIHHTAAQMADIFRKISR